MSRLLRLLSIAALSLIIFAGCQTTKTGSEAALAGLLSGLDANFIQLNLDPPGPRHSSVNLSADAFDREGNEGAIALAYLLRLASAVRENDRQPIPFGLYVSTFAEELQCFDSAITLSNGMRAKGEPIPRYWDQMKQLQDAGHLPAYIAAFRERPPSAGHLTSEEALEACEAWVAEQMPDANHQTIDAYGSFVVVPAP